MCEWVPGVEKTPDRIDALVWVITKLIEGSLGYGSIDLTKLICTISRNSMDRNDRTSAFYL